MTVRYRIAVSEADAHLYEVQVTIDEPDASGARIAMPAWIPGSYLIRDYSRNVVSIRAEADGVGVALEKLDKRTWRAAPVSRPLTITAEIFAWDESVRGAHLDRRHAYFNGTCVFPVVIGRETEPCELEVVRPDAGYARGWRVATAMRRKHAEPYGFGTYEAASYEELIDHPFEIGELTIGEFDAGGVPHAIAIRGRVEADMGRLCRDLEQLCTTQLGFLGRPDDLDRYLFLLNAPASGYGGLEHRWSSSLVTSRDNLPRRGQGRVDENYRTFLGLASHEYFHLWNVKRIRPQVFASSDLAEEAYTELLWVFEGITSYYDDLLLLRSGLITADDYFELLGRTITRVQRGAGRSRQSVADSSFDAWIKFYKPDANASNAIVSYYAKGALIALCLDLKLRVETDGRVSLDDVMHACWERYGQSGEGMPERGFEAIAAEVSGLDLDDFFDATVRGTGELPLETLLAQHGVVLNRRRPATLTDRGGKAGGEEAPLAVRLGATLVRSNDVSEFVAVDNGGPAERAGVAPGDQAVALAGLRLDADNVDRRLRHLAPGDSMALHVFRDDELLALEIEFDEAREDVAWLAPDDAAGDDAKARRGAWLEQHNDGGDEAAESRDARQSG